MDSLFKMNKFEVIDLPGMNTLAFLVERDYDAYSQGYAFLSLEKLRSVEVREENQVKKVFNVLVDDPEDEDDIVLLTLTDSKAFLSTGILDKNGFTVENSNVSLTYGSIYNTDGIEYRDVAYTPDLRRILKLEKKLSLLYIETIMVRSEVDAKLCLIDHT